MIALLLAALSLPAQPPRVDAIEVNTFTRDGEVVLRQILLRRWLRLPVGSSHYVEDWRVVQGEPQPYWSNGKRYIDVQTSEGVLTFESRAIRWTTTPYDPELRERDVYAPEQRRSYLPVSEPQ